jgi:hypothetical protein
MGGMFIYGVCMQLYMNRADGEAISERSLFIYISMLMPLINIENDTVALISGTIQMGLVSLVTSYVIYGGLASSPGLPKFRRSTAL